MKGSDEPVSTEVKAFSLMIVEDHPVMRETLCAALARQPDLRVVESVSSAEEVLDRLRHTSPDLLLVDVSLPGMSGLDLIERLGIEHPGLKCLVISGHNQDVYSLKSRAVGALGFVPKDKPSRLLEAVRKVLSGGDYWLE